MDPTATNTPAPPEPTSAPVNTSDIPPAPAPSPAQSTPAPVPDAPPSTLDVIKQTLETPDPATADTSAEPSPDAPAPDAPAPSPTAAIADDVIFSDPRVAAKLEEAKPALEMHTAFHKFINDTGVTGDQVDQSLDMLALFAKGDYGNFLDKVQPFLQAALEGVGRILPADLQAQVDAGTISEDVARAKVEARIAQKNFEKLQKQTQQAQASQQEAAIVEAGHAFWGKVQDADPATFAQRRSLYAAQVHQLASANPPRNAAQAADLCRQARDMVDKAFGPAVPAKPAVAKPTMPRPPVTTPAPQPATTKLGELSTVEAIQLALQTAPSA